MVCVVPYCWLQEGKFNIRKIIAMCLAEDKKGVTFSINVISFVVGFWQLLFTLEIIGTDFFAIWCCWEIWENTLPTLRPMSDAIIISGPLFTVQTDVRSRIPHSAVVSVLLPAWISFDNVTWVGTSLSRFPRSYAQFALLCVSFWGSNKSPVYVEAEPDVRISIVRLNSGEMGLRYRVPFSANAASFTSPASLWTVAGHSHYL